MYTCKTCGDTMEEIIPVIAHEHTYKESEKEATCTEDGTITYTGIKLKNKEIVSA